MVCSSSMVERLPVGASGFGWYLMGIKIPDCPEIVVIGVIGSSATSHREWIHRILMKR